MTRLVDATVLAEPGVVHRNAALSIDPDGHVGGLAPYDGVPRDGDLDLGGRVVIPGMTNGHTHSAMTLLRGHSDDVPLHTWLTHVRAFELRMTADDIAAGLRLALVEMLRSGTTGFVDMFQWDDALLDIVAGSGMRANVAPAVFAYDAVAFPNADDRPGRVVLDDTPRLAAAYAGHPLITVGYGLHAPYTCPPELIRDVARRTRDDGLGVHIHLSETRREVDDALAAHGVSPIRLVADLGLLDAQVHVAHAVHPVDGDIGLLARPNVTVSHNPVSNLKLGAGIAPAPHYRDAGVRLALGTDSVASNNTLDLFEELKMGAILHRGVAEDPSVLSGAEVLGWATRGGALAARAGGTGRIRVGEPADLVVLDVSGATGTPLPDVTSFVAYAATGALVTDVFVAGRRLVADRRVTVLDEDAVRADVRERVSRIRGELG
ncbi:amidohydrolase [Nakamurella deserti]|uniref:amidohydrolase n=1 Tax=Nakamurella deserti TaxID=2164074 RepID=UPI000DBEA31C|nr:amidohydrolase [Nakamurella deserti]